MTTDDIDRTFARFKRANETIRDLKPEVREGAIARLREGASNQELAQATGLTSEYFRKLAAELGIDNRRRPPTVGREARAAREARESE